MNQTYERFKFNSRRQLEGESVDAFLSSLRDLAKTCGFCNDCLPTMIMDRVVLGVTDSKVQTELLKIRKLTLDKCIDICKASETALAQNRAMRPSESVHKVKVQGHQNSGKYRQKPQRGPRSCKFCGE